MLNVDVQETDVTLVDLSIPAPATRRDVLDLIHMADERYRELNAGDPHLNGQPVYDDAYTIRVTDDRITARLINGHGERVNL